MQLIHSSFEIIPQTDVLKSIEQAGRVSHKSEKHIKEGSAASFVNRLIEWGHNSALEFGTIYLEIPETSFARAMFYKKNPYSRCTFVSSDTDEPGTFYITTNYRVIIDNGLEADLQWSSKSTIYHSRRICAKFILSRSIANQFVRHRKFSFMQESMRYVKYNDIQLIIPQWASLSEGSYSYGIEGVYCDGKYLKVNNAEKSFIINGLDAQENYRDILEETGKAENARDVLPLSAKTELYMCGYLDDWIDFFKLREDEQHADPNAYVLAHALHEEMTKEGVL